MKKRIILCMLAAAFLCSMLPSCGKEEEPPAPEPVRVTVMVDTKAELPVWEYIRQESGMGITLDIVPDREICNTLLLRQATKQKLPDLVYLKNNADMEALVRQDLLLDLNEHMDSLEEYRRARFAAETPDEIEWMARAEDGGMYLLPALGISRASTERAWLYRADVFERANLKIPNTMQELAETALALKKAFPNSTPVALRDGFYGLDLLAPAWKNDASIGVYYDFQDEAWRCGTTESWMGNFVSYWASMARSGLLPQNYLTMDAAAVDSLIAQNRVFMIPDSVWRLEDYKKKYPDQDWRMMPAPKAATEGAQHKIAKREGVIEGYAICNTGEDGAVSDALRFLNWMYSEEAEQILSWGLPGESYQEKNMEKVLILDENESAADRYGIGTKGLRTQLSPDAEKYIIPQGRIQNAYLAAVYTEENVNPARYLRFTSKEKEKIWLEQSKFKLVMETALSEFLTGKRPMTEWADFAQSLKNADMKRILDTYKKAYQRTKK